MLFGLLWVVVGAAARAAPREIMMAFWALFRIAFGRRGALARLVSGRDDYLRL